MRQRFLLVLAGGLLVLIASGLVLPGPASADSPSNTPSLARTTTVGFTYASVYKNRLVNAQAAIAQMQRFFDDAKWERYRHYSFLRDIMHNTIKTDDGFVSTPLGYGFGACGASSLLNKLVQIAKFRDKDGVEKPVFQTIMIWTWRGDKTYGQYGATIYIDETGKRTRDYIWELNPAYDGPAPKITTHFDMEAETAQISMEYADEVAADAGTAVATGAATGAATSVATSAAINAVASVETTVATVSPTSAVTQPVSTPAATHAPTSTATPTLVATQAANLQSSQQNQSGNTQTTKATIKQPTAVKDIAVADNSPTNSADTTAQTFPDPLGTAAQNTALLTTQLKTLIKGDRFGVSIVPVGSGAAQLLQEVDVNANMENYVASAFKGAVAIYFFENTDPRVWQSVPVHYWNAKDAKDVAEPFRADWSRNKDILYSVWTSAIWSQNDSTGNVIDYVYNNSPMHNMGTNPIIAFNNWTHMVVGVSEDSGLRSWIDGKTNCANCLDERYGQKAFVYQGKVLIPNNTYSPRDLAQIYVHLATKGRDLGYYDTATELLGTMRSPNAPSMIQYHMRKLGIQTASKDGFVAPNSEFGEGYYISTDAGLLTLPDGKQFAVAFMAFDSGNLLDDAMIMTGRILMPDASKSSKAAMGR